MHGADRSARGRREFAVIEPAQGSPGTAVLAGCAEMAGARGRAPRATLGPGAFSLVSLFLLSIDTDVFAR